VPYAPMATRLSPTARSSSSSDLRALRRRVRSRGAVSVGSAIKVGMGWALFLIMTIFYEMLPIASLQLLPFLFFGTVCLLSSLHDDAGLNGDCK